MIKEALCIFSGNVHVDATFFRTIDEAAQVAGLHFYIFVEDDSEWGASIEEPPASHPWATPESRAKDIARGNEVCLCYALEISDIRCSVAIDVPAYTHFTAGARLVFECARLGRLMIWQGDFERELDYWLRVETVLRAFHQNYPVSIWISHDKVPHDLILLSDTKPPPLPCVWPTSPLLKEVKLNPEDVKIVDKDLCELDHSEFPSHWRPFYEMHVFPSEQFAAWLKDKPAWFPLEYYEPRFQLWSGGRRGEGVCTLLWHDLHRGGLLYSHEYEKYYFHPPDDERHELRKRLWPLRTEDDVVRTLGEPSFRLGNYRKYDAEERKLKRLTDCLDMLVYNDLVSNCLSIIRIWEDGFVTALFSGFPKR